MNEIPTFPQRYIKPNNFTEKVKWIWIIKRGREENIGRGFKAGTKNKIKSKTVTQGQQVNIKKVMREYGQEQKMEGEP